MGKFESAEEVWGFFMKKLKVFIIVEFCLILFSSPVATLLSSDKEFSDMENRELAQKPVFSGKSFLDCRYQDNYEEWLNDQFSGGMDGLLLLQICRRHLAKKILMVFILVKMAVF